MSVRLDSLDRCFHGVMPGVIATCDRNGTPNIGYLSQVHYLDEHHVALSCQFFNKTRRNLDENPLACIELYEPLTWNCYRLRVRFLRSETEGPLFDCMAARIQAIASHTGMTGVFRLLSADVCEVLAVEQAEDFVAPAGDAPVSLPANAPLNELSGLQLVSERINRATDLDAVLTSALAALDEVFGFRHGMILVPDETGARLVTLASHGYGQDGIGAEVQVGEGLIGTVAAQRRLLRIGGMAGDLRYGRAIRARVHERTGAEALAPEIPLPGLPDAESQLAIPLLARDRLVGVLALEAASTLTFARWHEAFLQILGNQIAIAVDRLVERDEPDAGEPPLAAPAAPAPPPQVAGAPRRNFCFYPSDDCVFVDDEYLIRNVPGRILWKLLRAHQDEGRIEFSNRELRLDPSLGLPPIKDNLESRLILLRKRLEQKCPEVRLVPVRRGRFALEVSCAIELVERETA
jgi:adenylate cyclase